MREPLSLIVLAAALTAPVPSRAHYASITWSDITVRSDASIDYRLQIPFTDLSEALGLDSHRSATLAEVRGGSEQLAVYFASMISISAGDEPCRWTRHSVDVVEAAELRAELRLAASCPASARAVTVVYDVSFDHDPRHLSVYVVHHPGGELTGELSRRRPTLSIPLRARARRPGRP